MDARITKYIALLLTSTVAMSCQDPQLQSSSEAHLDLPAVRYNYFAGIDTTNAIPTLGRVLFYDRHLSVSNTVACASCHKQEFGFADNQKFSRGFDNRLTTRNSLPIQNLTSFNGLFSNKAFDIFGGPAHLFWDGRENDLQKLVLQPIGNHIEMGVSDAETLTKRLSELPYYTSLFNDAYGSPDVTTEKISKALHAFITSINSNQTRFDAFTQSRFLGDVVAPEQRPNPPLNPLEIEGFLLFQNKYDCNSCHQVQSPQGYAMMGGTFANIGLDKNYNDNGLKDVTGNDTDGGKFRIPSLRNVAFTAPYMHDGRFATLDDVLEHYSVGIVDHPNLDKRLKDNEGNARSMNISEHEKQAIIAFLKTLSDRNVLTDPKFSNPFKK